MKEALSRCLLTLILAVPLAAAAAPLPSQYLFVWAMEAKPPDASLPASMLGSMSGHMSPDLSAWRQHFGMGRDFLAVFDVRPGASFGQLITMLPVGEAVMAHARHPRLVRDFGSIGAYILSTATPWPHSSIPAATTTLPAAWWNCPISA